MSTTTNPRTRAALHGQLADTLFPTPTVAPEPPAVHPGTSSVIDDLAEIARRSHSQPRRMTAPRPEPMSLHEAYEWDPMPTESDPRDLGFRMDELEAAIAARSVPRQAPPVDPQATERTANLTEAYRGIEAIFG